LNLENYKCTTFSGGTVILNWELAIFYRHRA